MKKIYLFLVLFLISFNLFAVTEKEILIRILRVNGNIYDVTRAVYVGVFMIVGLLAFSCSKPNW